MALDEFSIIERYFGARADFAKLLQKTSDVRVGPGDDCAILHLAPGDELCVSTDTLIAEVHFPAAAAPAVIAQRVMAANLSDLAAMGAAPHSFLLALTMPEIDTPWLDSFASRLHGLAACYEIPLVGGDLCRGPLSLSMTVLGTAPAGTLVTRSGAQIGDDIYVTGFIGDAGPGLQNYLAQASASTTESASASTTASTTAPATADYLCKRYTQPSPRIEMGQALRPWATAMIDVSDGLLADLEHLLHASGGSTSLELEQLPLSEPLLARVGSDKAARLSALRSGDDYELCFTASPQDRQAIQSIANDRGLDDGVPITRLGVVSKGTGIAVTYRGQSLQIASRGYNHFASPK